jgi:hypothetical protein
MNDKARSGLDGRQFAPSEFALTVPQPIRNANPDHQYFPMTGVLVLYCSSFGHVERMTEAEAKARGQPAPASTSSACQRSSRAISRTLRTRRSPEATVRTWLGPWNSRPARYQGCHVSRITRRIATGSTQHSDALRISA